MSEDKPSFKDRVELIVAEIPYGKVMTYGQVAAICGNPRSARVVGQIAHFGNPRLPWHRIVSKSGGLANGYYGGKRGHKVALSSEGVNVVGYKIDLNKHLWWPDESRISKVLKKIHEHK